MSPNNDAKDVAYVITYLAGAPFGHVAHMLDAGAITAAKYTKERTQHQLMEALDALLWLYVRRLQADRRKYFSFY